MSQSLITPGPTGSALATPGGPSVNTSGSGAYKNQATYVNQSENDRTGAAGVSIDKQLKQYNSAAGDSTNTARVI